MYFKKYDSLKSELIIKNNMVSVNLLKNRLLKQLLLYV